MQRRAAVLLLAVLAVFSGTPASPVVGPAANKASDRARSPRLIVRVRGPLDTARHRVRTSKALYADRARSGASSAQIAAATQKRFASRARRAPRGVRVPDLGATYVLDLGTRSPAQIDQAIAELRRDPAVLDVEEDRPVPVAFVPNDPHYGALYGLHQIGSAAAWDTAKGDGVIVAIVDTGIDYTHPDIDANVWTNPGEIPGNGLDDDGNGFIDDHRGWDFVGPTWVSPVHDNDPQDIHGHGTHVAGTVAAEGDNGIGVIGVAWKAKVMATKGISDDGFGPISSLAAAIVYAADNGADVINASFGNEFPSTTLQEAVDYAHAHGVVFVAAAGNNNRDASQFYPASFTNAVAVAAVDQAGQKAPFSNFGRRIDVAAPGVDILSLQNGSGGYRGLSGTSMAAPHVAGVAALIVQRNPEFTSEQIRQALRTSADDLGAPGKDDSFGYGRASAASAVTIDEALEARLYSPADGTKVRFPQGLTGTARGTGFSHWTLEYGAGESPSAWTEIHTSSTPAVNQIVGTFDPGTLPDGLYTLRLRAMSVSGRAFTDQLVIEVRYVEITSPGKHDVPSLAYTAKPGVALPILGFATGVSFQSYRIEWAPGRDATTGWSTVGVTLTGGGNVPVEGGQLGTWIPAASLAGEHTLRLTVTSPAFSNAWSATVYLEPDLVAGWPRFAPNASWDQAPLPVRDAAGMLRFVTCGRMNEMNLGTGCTSTAADGSQSSVFHARGGQQPPSAGNLDPAAGDEVLAVDGASLRIYSARLDYIRDVYMPGEVFGYYSMMLADLDNDGTHEILAVTRHHDAASGWYRWTGRLHVYRANGQPYSSRYPMDIVSSLGPDGRHGHVTMVAADLNGDGVKEILLALRGVLEIAQYTIQAYNADGSVYSAWPAVGPFPAAFAIGEPIAADLDHDGSVEIIVTDRNGGIGGIRILGHDGSSHPGWPMTVDLSPHLAVGDLDRDGKDEIVGTDAAGVVVFRQDGTEYGRFAWPATSRGPLTLADVDGDGFPDVVGGYIVSTPYAGGSYYDNRLRAITRTGALIEDWRVFGFGRPQPPTGVTAAIGDWDGDGKSDLALSLIMNRIDGSGIDGTVSVLSTGAAFDVSRADWPHPGRDPQNSRSRPVSGGSTPPPARIGAAADAYVRDGSHAGSNFGTATSLAVKATSAAGNNRLSYLRFPLSGLAGSVTNAKLRLHGSRTTASSATDSAYAVASNSWTETGINWNNRPTLGARQGTPVTITPAAQYYEWDVTVFVAAQKAAGATAVSLAVAMDVQVNDSPDSFGSREAAAANRPELVVTTAPETPPSFSGHYKILGRHSGKAVVVQNASTANGANVFQWTYGGSSTNDEWLFTSIGSGFYRITARHSGKAMVVQGASTANAGDVVQWSYTSSSPANDEWSVENAGLAGYYRLTNRHSSKVLNVSGAGTGDGANVDQWSWANVSQQQFQIVAVP
jgi:subtilisin family serine protease